MPPCARLVLLSLGSVARVTSVTGIPASARHRATVPPATPQPRISTSVSMHSFMLLPCKAPLAKRDDLRRLYTTLYPYYCGNDIPARLRCWRLSDTRGSREPEHTAKERR